MVHSVTARYVSDRFLLLFKRLNAISILLLLITLVSSVSVFYSLNQLRLASEHRLQSYTLSNELRLSSDQLTMMARAYASTGNIEFKDFFDQILAIRNGQQSRPVYYHRVYWDFKLPGVKGNYDHLNSQYVEGNAIAFEQLLADLKLTKEEKQFLSAAKLESDSLTRLENLAFQYIAQGNASKGQEILYSSDYFSAKANIMANINEFHRALEQRTEIQLELWLKTVYLVAIVFVISIVILLSLLLYKSYIRSRLDGSILDMLNEEVEKKTHELSHNNDMLKTAINDLKKAQNQLIESEKMSLLGGLVAGVAHEINTPVGVGITAISSQKEELKRLQELFQQGSMTKSDFQQFIDYLHSANEMVMSNLYRIVDLISVFKKLSIEQDLDEKIPIELHKYVDDIVDSIRSGFKHRNLAIVNNVDPELNFESYPGAIAQIVSNIIRNSDLHGVVSESQGKVEIDAVVESGELLLTITDNGQGMPESVVKKIFDPFYTHHRKGHSTGLGMNIVYTLVTQKLSGQVTCISEEDKGTKVVVRFPVDL